MGDQVTVAPFLLSDGIDDSANISLQSSDKDRRQLTVTLVN